MPPRTELPAYMGRPMSTLYAACNSAFAKNTHETRNISSVSKSTARTANLHVSGYHRWADWLVITFPDLSTLHSN